MLSLGAGVQSTTLLLMALHGEFLERPDCAIFADTGWEPRAVYEHLAWLEREAGTGGIPVHRVTAGNLKQDLLAAVRGERKRVANPPFHIRNRAAAVEYATPDRGGMLWRKCTRDYKIAPIRRKLRAMAEAAVGSRRLPAGCVEQWFGISSDEWRRVRTSDVAYVVHHYPLVDRRLTRTDCLAWLEGKAAAGGIPVHRVTAGNLKQDVLAAVRGERTRVANPPFYVRNRDPTGGYPTPDRGGMLWRKCTKDYKIDPIRRKLRAMAEAAVGSRRLPAGCVEQWFGISHDEWRRMRTSDVAYVVNRYPLVDRRLTRADCVAWLRARGYRVPPKSACLGCPYHSQTTWREMKRHRPDEWADTVAFDRAIRRGLPGVTGEAFVHRSLIPLDVVDLRTDAERGQPRLPGFDDECSGHCGV